MAYKLYAYLTSYKTSAYPSGAKLLSAIAPKTKVAKVEFHFISRNIDVNKEKERLSPEYGDWLVSKVIKASTRNECVLVTGVIQPTYFHYLHKPNDTCSFDLNI